MGCGVSNLGVENYLDLKKKNIFKLQKITELK
jgi:hypothetical protein